MKSSISIFVFLTLSFTVAQLHELRNHLETDIASIIRAHSGCECDDTCPFDFGAYNISCGITRAVYFSCKQSSCKVEACPNDQLFDSQSMSCMPCKPGEQVRSKGKIVYCGCPFGTYRNANTAFHCVPCNTEKAGWEGCYCQGLVPDETNNGCRKCPNNTLTGLGRCSCIDPKMFWSDQDFTCKECPGVLVERENFRETQQKYTCICEGENMIFNYQSATCTKCPSNSVSKLYDNYYGRVQGCTLV